MISSIICAIIATFIVMFVTNKDANTPDLLKVNEMFTKENLLKTIPECKTRKALFIFIVTFLSAFLSVLFF